MENNHKDLSFKSEIGSRAKVTREDERSERAFKVNGQLKDIGRLLKPDPTAEYLGSAAVHVYLHKGSDLIIMDDEAMFLCQTTTLQDCPPQLANAAAIQLNQQLQQMFTGRRQTKRSGF